MADVKSKISIIKNVKIPSEAKIIVLSLVKDEEYFIPAFLEHYKSLGVGYFVFLDNGSSDRTKEIVAAEKNAVLLSTDLDYKSYQYCLKKYLVSEYGDNRWSLIVDADEFFDYPLSSKVGLNELIGYLERNQYNCMYTPLVDMFSDKSLSELKREDGGVLCPNDYLFCDTGSVYQPIRSRVLSMFLGNGYIRHKGGVRLKVFGVDCALYKFALTYCSGNKPLFETAHRVLRSAKVADVSGVLFHYKFVSNFIGKAKKAIEEENYYNNSIEYDKYLKAISSVDDFSFSLEGSKCVNSVDDIVGEGVVFLSRRYSEFAKGL